MEKLFDLLDLMSADFDYYGYYSDIDFERYVEV